MQKYVVVYLQLFNYALKKLAEYRLNSLLRFIYMPTYVLVIYAVMQIAYHSIPTLGGWTRDEGVLLFLYFHILYGIAALLFLDGIRDFMWNGARLGKLDYALTKPVDPQFLVTFGRPGVDALLLFIGATFFFVRHLATLPQHFEFWQYGLFAVAFLLSCVISYGMFASYATLSIHVARAGQMVEFLDKMTDSAVYPTTIFPPPVQLIAFTFIPFAFFAYLPCGMLLGKLPWQYLWMMLGFALFSIGISRAAWALGLRRYTSASS